MSGCRCCRFRAASTRENHEQNKIFKGALSVCQNGPIGSTGVLYGSPNLTTGFYWVLCFVLVYQTQLMRNSVQSSH